MKRFALAYLGWLLPALVLWLVLPAVSPLDVSSFTTHLLASWTENLLLWMDVPVQRQGLFLYFPHAVMEVVEACNGLLMVALYGAGVLAYRAAWPQKLAWLGIGLAAIEAANLLRLLFLSYILEHHFAYYGFFHYVVGQGTMILCTLALFIAFVRSIPLVKKAAS